SAMIPPRVTIIKKVESMKNTRRTEIVPWGVSLFTGHTPYRSCFRLFSLRQKHIDDQQPGSHDYGHIGYVESRVMPRAELDVYKIYDEPEADAVDHVAHDPGEKQRQRTEDPVVGPRCSPEEIYHQRSSENCDDRQSPTPGVTLVVQHRKCGTCVLGVVQVQKAGYQSDLLSKTQTGYRPRLGALIN